MYCPNCATSNLEGARFCRSCGADISLVPQALTGHLPENQGMATEKERRHGGAGREAALLDKAIKNIFMGLGFLIVAIILTFIGRGWGFWMFIPAFTMLGGGVAAYMRHKDGRGRALPGAPAPPGMFAAAPPQRAGELPRRNTAELVMPPPSVTEGTTRHLGAEAPTRHIGRAVENSSGESQADS